MICFVWVCVNLSSETAWYNLWPVGIGNKSHSYNDMPRVCLTFLSTATATAPLASIAVLWFTLIVNFTRLGVLMTWVLVSRRLDTEIRKSWSCLEGPWSWCNLMFFINDDYCHKSLVMSIVFLCMLLTCVDSYCARRLCSLCNMLSMCLAIKCYAILCVYAYV